MRSAHRRSVQAEGSHVFGELFVFLLLGMFAVFSLMAVVAGAGVYRSVVEAGSPDGQTAMPLSYVANKVRARMPPALLRSCRTRRSVRC